MLLSPPALSQLFADAMAASPAQRATLMSMLLHLVLPRLAQGMAQGLGSHSSGGLATNQQPLLGVTETGLLMRLPVVLTSPALAAFLGDCLCLPGGAQHLQLAAQILRALPSSRPAVVDAGSYFAAAAAGILAALTMAMVGGLKRSQHINIGSNGSRMVSANSEDFIQPPGVDGSGDRERSVAAREMLQLLPAVAGALHGLEADSLCPADDLALMCRNYSAAVRLVTEYGGTDSWEQLAPWAAAADAAVRLAPLLLQLGDCGCREGSSLQPERQSGPHLQASRMWTDVWHEAARRLFDWLAVSGSGGRSRRPPEGWGQAEFSALAAQLWQLHSSGCRMLHWLAAQGSTAVLWWVYCELEVTGCWRLLLRLLDKTFQSAAVVMEWAAEAGDGR